MTYDLGIIKRQRYVEPTFIALGGTISTGTSNAIVYTYHTFTTSSNFVPVYDVSAECLIVGGGGAGSDIAGGGAGGYRSLTINFQKNNTFSVTVGQGGTTATTSGYDSSIIGNGVNYVASGGGNAGQPGGSGGGGSGSPGSGANGNTPSTSPSQGNNGGDTSGGGASAAGSGTLGGAGATWLNGSSYAGGGSGGGGASDGGGASSVGTPNTGGGGSIGNFAGGSGIVIIRYRKYLAATQPAFDANFAYNTLLLSNQSATFDFSTGVISMLLIGGGGGGGGGGTYSSVGYVGGGGGAGGLYTNTFSPTVSTTLIVTIGAGGAGAASDAVRFASTGTSSTIRGKQPLGGDTAQTITATGGGAGQSYSYAGAYTSSSALANGGSGGGSPGGTAGSSTLSQNDGPNYYGHAGYLGGAGAYVAQGGGAGNAGGAGAGGIGKYINIANSSTFSSTFSIGGGGYGGTGGAGAIGGDGGSGSGGTGFSGGAGLAFFWHLSSLPIATVGSTNAYSISFQNDYTIYAFINGSGTITFGPQWGNRYLKDSSVIANPVQGYGNMLAQGSFNPYSTNWSTYFNGTTDYLTIQHNDAFNINSDFTVEGWIYPTSSTTSTIITKSITAEKSPFNIKLSAQNTITTSVLLINDIPPSTVEYLLVGGGGGGGRPVSGTYGGGGGGGGGILFGSVAISSSSGITYTITVGQGGTPNVNGGDSTFAGGTAFGGGSGSSGFSDTWASLGQAGGSGGGAGIHSGARSGGAATQTSNNGGTGLGYAGGNNYSSSPYWPGGGGGAGGPGIGAINTASGGGAGYASSITGATIYYGAGGGGGGTTYGNSTVYGQGGGASTGTATTSMIVGSNTGGDGSTASYPGSSGIFGTGGGGGGNYSSTGINSGGTGTVIIRYPDSYPPIYTITGNPTILQNNGYRIYIWTSNGSATFAPVSEKQLVSTQINLNTWNHVSISKSGSTYTSMLNGGNQVTTSSAATIYNNTQTIYIGYDGTNYFQGYISNLRFLNGTSMTNVPRLPFPVVTNTALLVSASGLLIDKSNYNFTVTQNGTPAIRRFSPFVNSGAYNNLVLGGSIYFNGSTDFISVPPNAVNFQNNSFNIEFWSYPEPISSTAYFIDSRYSTSNSLAFGTATTATNDGISLALLTSGLCTVNIGTATTFTSINLETLRVKFRAWNHIALVRNNTLVSLYINGTPAGSTSTSVTVSTVVNSLYTAVSPNFPLVTNNFSIGRSSYLSGNYYKGYLSNLQILKGNISERETTTPGPLGNTIEYLIVAGGGGGGGTNNEFGGGGGGFRYGSFITTQSGATYNITVGSGGSLNGGNSSIIGGGMYLESAGGGNYTVSAGAGGSGSGGYGVGNTPSTSPAQGYNGGLSGGGGAGAPGIDWNGGTGSTSTITGSSLMYAGGGGGNNTTGVLIGGNGGAGGGGYGWASLTFEYLVVGGGGLGGNPGGGGGGGFLTSSFISTITSATFVITVGGSATDSSIVGGGINILAYAGGAGGRSSNSGIGQPGGSGGGPNGGIIVVGQGNVGGADGGGGGAGTAGAYNGGDGLRSNIDGLNYYYSGGGGGRGSNTGGNGGLGGGGKGTGFLFGSVGTGGRNVGVEYAGGTNTGGGGGTNGLGGSGIVIIRYAGTQVCTGGSVSTYGTYTVHTFLTSGTLVENITGDTTRAGTAGTRGAAANGGTNTGGGGGGAGSGGSGIVAIRYLGQPRGFGGNITTNVYGLYTVHTFLSSDTYVDKKITYNLPVSPVLTNRLQSSGFTIYYMAVAGGGAGGAGGSQTSGGGGGAGGLVVGSFTATDSMGLINITVGSGGAVGSNNGQDSQIFGLSIPPNLLAKGGGYGGGALGADGGSGGGGKSDVNAQTSYGGAATQNTLGINGSGTGYGNAGRGGGVYGIFNGSLTNTLGGGGGGAGSVGYQHGNGGDGLYVSVANSSTYSGTFATGGALGGLSAGTVNTGNGGAGGVDGNTVGGAGGSGKVILWHLDTLATSPIVNATGVYTTNSYKVYVFNSSGFIEFKYSDTSLLLNFSESKIFDATTHNDLYPIGDVSISNSIIKYNNASIYFDGDGDGLGIGSTSTTTATNLTAVGSGNFTVEMWMYPLSLYNTGTAPALLDSRTTSTSVTGSSYFGYTGVNLAEGSQIGWKDNTTFITTGTVIINNWNHVAVVRSGSNLTMYINGAVTSSTTNTTNYTIPFKYIGISYNSLSFKGYIDDLRISQTARYLDTFTPPLTTPQLK